MTLRTTSRRPGRIEQRNRSPERQPYRPVAAQRLFKLLIRIAQLRYYLQAKYTKILVREPAELRNV